MRTRKPAALAIVAALALAACGDDSDDPVADAPTEDSEMADDDMSDDDMADDMSDDDMADDDMTDDMSDPTVVGPARIVILEGAYSARPELADLLDSRLLLDTDAATRHRRLSRRDGDADRDKWVARWTQAEDHYFGTVMPPSAFDLVL